MGSMILKLFYYNYGFASILKLYWQEGLAERERTENTSLVSGEKVKIFHDKCWKYGPALCQQCGEGEEHNMFVKNDKLC